MISALGAYRHTSHERLLREAGIEPLYIRRRYFALCLLYKMVNGLTPPYLSYTLPPYVVDSSRYPLRNLNNFSIPRTSKTYVRLSFFWHTLYDWNSIDLSIRQSPSISAFKSRMKRILFYLPNPLFNVYTPNSSTHHARMRMGLSALNAQRKNYNFINFSDCPLCGHTPEDTIHYLLKCPNHAIHRANLMRAIATILNHSMPGLNTNPMSNREFKALNEVLLCGSVNLSFDENCEIFKAVHIFIGKSKRFDTN